MTTSACGFVVFGNCPIPANESRKLTKGHELKRKIVPEVPKVRVDSTGKKKVYYLDYYDPSVGERVRPRVGTRRDVAEKEANRIYNLMMETHLGHKKKEFPDITLAGLIEFFFNGFHQRASTVRRYRTFATNFMAFMGKNFPDTTMASGLKRAYVELFLSELEKAGQKPKTLNNQLFFIKTIFRLAVLEGIVETSPVANIHRYPNPQSAKKAQYWEKEQLERFLLQ